MKALVYHGDRQMRLQDLPEPSLEVDEVLVSVAAVGVCGSDLGLVSSGQSSMPPPLVLGHEFGGHLDDGSFVVVNPIVFCGECRYCEEGRTHLCTQRKLVGFRRQGAYAQRIAVPRRSLVPAPDLTTLQATLVEPMANGVHAWHRAGRPMARVAIIGAGSVGLSLLHVLRAKGVVDITVADPQPGRLAHASAMGADHVMPTLAGEFEAVFDAAGTRSTRALALSCVVPGGTVALIGLHDDDVSLSASALLVSDKTVCGCFAYTMDEFREAAALARQADTSWVHRVSFDQSQGAFEALLGGRGSADHAKTVFEFSR